MLHCKLLKVFENLNNMGIKKCGGEMSTLKKFAKKNNLPISNVLYYLKLNEIDVLENKYCVYLYGMLEDVLQGKEVFRKNSRFVSLYWVKNIVDENKFQKEFFAYMKHLKKIKEIKKKAVATGLAWTRSALECLEANGNCEKCVNKYICTRQFQVDGEYPMHKTVKKLLAVIGNPNEIDKIRNFPQSIIQINRRA